MVVSARLAVGFMETHPTEAARVLEGLSSPVAAAALGLSGPETAATIVSSLGPATAIACLTHLEPRDAAAILERAGPDVASRLLREMDDPARSAILTALPSGPRGALERLLSFPEDTVGSHMDPRVLALPDDITIGGALDRLRREAERFHGYAYVVDRGGRLTGVTSIRELMLAGPGSLLGTVMQSAPASLSGHARTSELLAHPGWESFHALPVVDRDGILIGVIVYSTFQRLRRGSEARSYARDAVLTGLALAEVFWITLMNAMAAATSVAGASRTAARSAEFGSREGA